MIEMALTKRLHTAHGEINLSVEMTIGAQKLVTLYGKSGTGKTTILRMLCGLMQADGGYIRADNRLWYHHEEKINLAPQKRGVGMVFQDYALFPNMTVRKNLEFASRGGKDRSFIDEILTVMDLKNLRDRYPALLSGGQKQRVALARALVAKPDVLLLDEPLSALDTAMRQHLQEIILEIHKRFALTIILVSHDVEEILKLSDQIFVIDNGKVFDAGKPGEVLRAPADSGIVLTAVVRSIERKNSVYELTLSTDESEVKAVLPESCCAALRIGDQIELSGSLGSPRARKIVGPNNLQERKGFEWERSLDMAGRFSS